MSEVQSNKIYFPVYKSIEKEVLELASSIHFTDITHKLIAKIKTYKSILTLL